MEFHRPLRAGRGVEAALSLVREVTDPLEEDRPLGGDIEALASRVRAGAFARVGEDVLAGDAG